MIGGTKLLFIILQSFLWFQKLNICTSAIAIFILFPSQYMSLFFFSTWASFRKAGFPSKDFCSVSMVVLSFQQSCLFISKFCANHNYSSAKSCFKHKSKNITCTLSAHYFCGFDQCFCSVLNNFLKFMYILMRAWSEKSIDFIKFAP